MEPVEGLIPSKAGHASYFFYVLPIPHHGIFCPFHTSLFFFKHHPS